MRRIAVCSAACGFIIVAAVWAVNSASHSVVSHAIVVDARFPNEPDYFKSVDPAPNDSVARIGETFDLVHALTLPPVEPFDHMRVYSVLGTGQSTTGGPAQSSAVVTAASRSDKRTAQPRHAMFNEAQIASIKARLALDQEQVHHWPAVEEALRAVAWRELGAAVQLEPASVQKLVIASAVLISTLREPQKRDLRVFARLMGLDRLASRL